MTRLNGRTALVTGGCGGIGRAAAAALAGAGVKVIAADSRRNEAALAEIEAAGALEAFLPVDVADARSVRAMVDAAQTRTGTIDILVTAAGITSFGSAAGLTEDEFDRVVAINLKGTFLCCQAVIPAMRAAGGGRIITIGSVLAKNGGNPRPWIDPREQERAANLAYGASKAGVHALTLYLAKELAADGITVNAVAPGPIASAMTTGFPDTLRTLIPVGRLGEAAEVAHAVLYLADPAAGFVTGEIHDVNGGLWVD